MIVGITGRIASGKGVLTNYLMDLGFKQISLSQEVREEATIRGLEITRENLQNLGDEMRRQFGAGIWAKKVVERINKENYPNWVIEGIRNPAEIIEFKKLKNFFLVAIDADRELRFKRLLQRSKPSDPRIFEEFVKIDDRDFCDLNNELGQQVGKCMQLADFEIENNSSFQEMSEKVKEVYYQIKNKIKA